MPELAPGECCGTIVVIVTVSENPFPQQYYQIFEFDINIQMLVWIIGSTYTENEKF